MPRRKICVVTGSRAEYGLLYWFMREVQEDPDLELQVAVTGMHLSPEFGLTVETIAADGFTISARVEMLLSSDSAVGVTKSIGLGVIGFADAIANLQPDIMVLLGDRFEILAAAQAALIAKVLIAHIHGGEVTEGSLDESIRHAITKMAHIHFVATEEYRRRVIQMGEPPDRVMNYGAPALDSVRKLNLLDRSALEASLGVSLGSPLFLVTYHPVTLGEWTPEECLGALFAALDQFPDSTILFTQANADPGGRVINQLIARYVEGRKGRTRSFASLGHLRYLSAARYADAVIGNSSSGLIEVPFLGTPTVNIGDRQRGRIRPTSVMDCAEDEQAIAAAIARILSPAFRAAARTTASPYAQPDTSHRIKGYLKREALQSCPRKVFHDVEYSEGQPRA